MRRKKNSRKACCSRPSNPLDLAIEGDGFFQVTLPDGTTAYTRDGSFKEDSNGSIVTADGYFLQPADHDSGERDASLGRQDGTVTALAPGQLAPTQLGQITLVRFSNQRRSLAARARTCTSKRLPRVRRRSRAPGLNGAGSLQGGYLEQSNVSVVTEIVNLIIAQRAFEANSKAIGAADQMLQTAIQMSPFQ